MYFITNVNFIINVFNNLDPMYPINKKKSLLKDDISTTVKIKL